MPRAVDGTRRKDRRNKILNQAKGFWGRRGTNLRAAKDSVARAGVFAYRDRKKKKSDFRRIWITRISAICRNHDMNYSQFMYGLKKAGIVLNRKALSNLAIEDENTFLDLVGKAKDALGVQV